MITIVDYGLGNIYAFQTVYKRLNIECRTARNREELEGATKIILPGVGHFDQAMHSLQASGMRETLDRLVVQQCVPVLGVCVGMQMLARASEEGLRPGLGWIDGRVVRFRPPKEERELPVPHMGWNDVHPKSSSPLFRELEREARFYFLHSYCFECSSPEEVLATSHYGKEFSSGVRARNVYGVQFHPEKSHHFGTQLLRNFAEL